MWGILTLVATWAFLYEGKEWQASERFGVAAAVTVWFTIGGFRDLRRMFDRLRNYVPDEADDGHVTSSRDDVRSDIE